MHILKTLITNQIQSFPTTHFPLNEIYLKKTPHHALYYLTLILYLLLNLPSKKYHRKNYELFYFARQSITK